MNFINHPKTSDRLSKVCFGGASISGEGAGYGFGNISEKDSISLVHQSIDLGINLFDTAPIYGFCESEKRLGKALKGKRHNNFIISKSGVSWHKNKRVNMSNDPLIAQAQLEQSLRDLQTDYIDYYLVHWPDPNHQLDDLLNYFLKAKIEGKIRNIGLCNTNNEDLKIAKDVTDISILQSESNLFNNGFRELELMETDFKMGWGTFDKGILTGSVTKERSFDKYDCRSWAPWWKKSNWKEKVEFVQKLSKILKTKEELVRFAMSYSFNINKMDSVICGFKNMNQLLPIVSTLDLLIEVDELMDILKKCQS